MYSDFATADSRQYDLQKLQMQGHRQTVIFKKISSAILFCVTPMCFKRTPTLASSSILIGIWDADQVSAPGYGLEFYSFDVTQRLGFCVDFRVIADISSSQKFTARPFQSGMLDVIRDRLKVCRIIVFSEAWTTPWISA